MQASTTTTPVEYIRNKTPCMVTGVLNKLVLQTLYKREIWYLIFKLEKKPRFEKKLKP